MLFATNMFHRFVKQSQAKDFLFVHLHKKRKFESSKEQNIFAVVFFYFVFYTVFSLMNCTCIFVLQNVFRKAMYKWEDKEEIEIRTRQKAFLKKKRKKKKWYDTNKIAINYEKFLFPSVFTFLNLNLPYCAVCHLS